MNAILVAACLMLGSLAVLVAALGVYRLPDLYSRMHIATKANTLGIILTVLGLAASFVEFSVTARGALIVFFVFLTTPVGAQVLSYAAYLAGTATWPGTKTIHWANEDDSEGSER